MRPQRGRSSKRETGWTDFRVTLNPGGTGRPPGRALTGRARPVGTPDPGLGGYSRPCRRGITAVPESLTNPCPILRQSAPTQGNGAREGVMVSIGQKVKDM